MVAERAKHQGDDFLGNQPKWWNHLSCRKPWMKSDDETLEKNEIEDDYDGDAIECNPSIQGIATECSKNLEEPFESSFTPSVEAVFSIEGIKECSVKLPILKINFIEKCCKGLVDLSKYKSKPILIECIECNISFGNLLEKQQHFANLHPEYKSCPFCLKVFPPTTKLSNHLMEQNCCEDIPQLKLLCPKCHVSEYNYKNLFRHFNHVHKGPLPNQTHRCLSCNFVYFEKKQLDDHFKHSHKEHKCKKCAASFKSKVLAISHMALQHPDSRFGDFCKRVAGQPLQCFVCDAVFPRESRMAKHFLQYHPELMGTLEAPDVVLELAEQEEKCHTPTIKYDSNDSDDSAQKRFIPKDVPIERIVPGKRISTLTFHCPHCEKFFYKRFSLRKHVEQHLKNPKIPVVSTVSIEVSSKIQDQDSKPPTNLVISKPQPDTATKPMPLSCDKSTVLHHVATCRTHENLPFSKFKMCSSLKMREQISEEYQGAT
ncbi:Hypothetical predicted protein [Cloeon dipterum]|uniref:C2H2-type domain-containing protein n=1 Tax=Cloeon dipterum TaxID=197152 RepID=A0A8S1CVT5_9INSE|nr:Hypothetical predicted protein [Cloeon dipterum]